MSTVLRRSRRSILGALGAFSVSAGTQRPSSTVAAEQYTMRFNLTEPATAVTGIAALHFAAAVERRSNGQLKIEVYPSGQLAKEAETIDDLITGTIDFAAKTTPWFVPLFPRWQVFDMPFLFKDQAAAFRVLDGPIGAEFFKELETKGLVGLGWGINGFKELETTTKAVVVPEDVRGLRVRIQSGAIYAATYQALGAIPVTVDVSETYTALSQHTVDGTEVSLDNFAMNKWYNVEKHVALTNHVLSIDPIVGSKRKIEALPAALQKIVREEGRAVIPYWRSLNVPRLAEAMQFLKQNGVVFTNVQHDAFRRAMDPVYAILQSRVGGDLIERISRAAGSG